MKYVKHLNIILSIMFLVCIFNTNVFAAEASVNNSEMSVDELKKAAEEFENMTVDELNDYIDNIADSAAANSRSGSVPTSNVKLAWIAAAEIAENEGYTCSAALVRSSVYNISYTEKVNISGTKELFQKKISAASNYVSFIANLKSGKTYSNPYSMTFTKSHSSDLYYSLHKVSVYHTKTAGLYSVRIYDVFDFDVDSNYDDLFTTCVNNWAWLCQQTDVLNKITVNISMQ